MRFQRAFRRVNLHHLTISCLLHFSTLRCPTMAITQGRTLVHLPAQLNRFL